MSCSHCVRMCVRVCVIVGLPTRRYRSGGVTSLILIVEVLKSRVRAGTRALGRQPSALSCTVRLALRQLALLPSPPCDLKNWSSKPKTTCRFWTKQMVEAYLKAFSPQCGAHSVFVLNYWQIRHCCVRGSRSHIRRCCCGVHFLRPNESQNYNKIGPVPSTSCMYMMMWVVSDTRDE
jgi:hypothetical protein